MDLLLDCIQATQQAASSLSSMSQGAAAGGEEQLLLCPANAEAIAAMVDLSVSEASLAEPNCSCRSCHMAIPCMSRCTAAWYRRHCRASGALMKLCVACNTSIAEVFTRAIQVRGLLEHEDSKAQTSLDLAQRAQTVLQEAQAACCPAQWQPRCQPAACALEDADRSALPEWRSSSVAALLRTLQSELTAAESALASAVERQASLRPMGAVCRDEWSIGAMRQEGLDKALGSAFGSSQALAKLSKCLKETCKGDDAAEDGKAMPAEQTYETS